MKVKAIKNMLGFKASVLQAKYGLSVNKAREFKTGTAVEVNKDVADNLVAAGLIAPVPVTPEKKKGVKDE